MFCFYINDIFNSSFLEGIKNTPVEEAPVQITLEESAKTGEAIEEELTSDLEIQLTKKLNELYERYHELSEMGKRDFSLENEIVEIEAELKDLTSPDSNPFGK